MSEAKLSKYEQMLEKAGPYDMFVRYRAQPELLWDAMNIEERKEHNNDFDAFSKGYRKRAFWMMLLAFVLGIGISVLMGVVATALF